MRANLIAAIVDAAIPLLGGVYATLLGFRAVGRRAGESVRYDLWHERYATFFKVGGPLLVAFGLLRIAMGLMGK